MSAGILTSAQRRALAVLLLGGPLGVTGLLAFAGWIPAHTIISTALGVFGVSIGGLAVGVTARRYLAWSRHEGETLFGLGAVTATGVVAMGYIYLFHLPNPIATVTDPARVVEQTAIFVTFLGAQVVGILWAERIFPEQQRRGENSIRR